MNALYERGRITRVPYEEHLPVHTAWDLGIDDATVIWFFQVLGREFRFIDFHEDSGEGFPYYARVLQSKGYFYGTHFMPHDIMATEFGTGKSRYEVACGLFGHPNVFPVKRLDVADGVDAVREMLPKCYFDQGKCKPGLEALMAYKKNGMKPWRRIKLNLYMIGLVMQQTLLDISL